MHIHKWSPWENIRWKPRGSTSMVDAQKRNCTKCNIEKIRLIKF